MNRFQYQQTTMIIYQSIHYSSQALIVVTLVVCCQSQLDIPKRLDRLSDALGLVPAPVPNFAIAQPGLAVAQPVAVAPGPIVSAINRPIGLAAPAQYAWGGLSSIPIQKFRSQEVLPIQDLGVVNGGPQVIQVSVSIERYSYYLFIAQK